MRDALVHLRPWPDILYVSRSRTVLATNTDGFVDGSAGQGLFFHETRLISRYFYRINGELPTAVALSNIEQHSWLGYYVALPPGIPSGPPDTGSGQMQPVSEHTLELRVSRYASDGIHEDLSLTNFSRYPTEFELALELDADFADVVETRGRRLQHGRLAWNWGAAEDGAYELSADYRASHDSHSLHRGVRIRILRGTSQPYYQNKVLRFNVRLAPQESWRTCLEFSPVIEGKVMDTFDPCQTERPDSLVIHSWESERLEARILDRRLDSLSSVVTGTLRRARKDLIALRLHDADDANGGWNLAAGLPLYIALYGRDMLTSGWQSALIGTQLLKGALGTLAQLQGRVYDDWRDEQPGRILHEVHTGPLEELGYNPRSRYYGSITTSAFFPVALSELWHWTGDKELIAPLVDPALRALDWLDRDADIDKDGFYEYLTRSEQGVKHQAWKDSPNAIVGEKGDDVEPPIATCEEQGFAYAGKLHLSEVLWWLDRKDDAKRLFSEASELKKRFNEAYWMENESFFAIGLGPDKQQIRSIGSNPGHCLATGIVDSSLVPALARRLFEDDLFTGWGIRTLSSLNPAYNPYSYHRGSVWPVEQGTFALGFARYGLISELHRITHAQFEAASLFASYRLPEAFSGHTRDQSQPFPAMYPQANAPQAWSASTVFLMLQAILGIYPYAPLHLLLLDPHLPEWLPSITLESLRVGNATLTIHFVRKPNGETTYRVLEQKGHLHVIRQPSPWSLTAGTLERVVDLFQSLLPGR
jgi:glycogen debranching enzyme